MEREGDQNLGLPHHNIIDALDEEGQELKRQTPSLAL